MRGTPEEHAELIELENKVAHIEDDIERYRANNKDNVERRVMLTKMHKELGENRKRLKELQKIVYTKGD